MKQKIFERIKSYFSFLSFSDQQLMSIVNKVYDENKTEEENFEQVMVIFYSVVKDRVDNGDIALLLLANSFDCSDNKSAIKSLNEFAIFLSKCGIEFDSELENKIKEQSPDFEQVLQVVSELSSDDIDELNSFAVQLIDKSSFSSSEKIEEVFDEDEEEEKEEKFKSFRDISFTDDSTKQYLNEIGRIPLLTADEEETIYKEYRRTHDPKLRKRILEANLRLVVSVASDYAGIKGLSLLELISAGSEGIIRALEDYDPEKAKFSTYAITWIKQKILREIQNTPDPIRIPTNLKNESVRFHKLKVEMETQRGRSISLEELSDITRVPLKKVKEYERVFNQSKAVSMDSPVGEDEDSKLSDFIEDTSIRTPEQEAIFNDLTRVNAWLSHLKDPTEVMIIRLRSGLYDGREYKLEEISSKLIELKLRDQPVSRQRVEQIEKRALRKLRGVIEAERRRTENPRAALRAKVVEDINKEQENNRINIEFMRLVKFIRITNVTVLSRIFSTLPEKIKENLVICFGYNIYAGTVQKPTLEDKKEAAYVSFPYLKRAASKIMSEQIEKNIEEVELPRNLYLYFEDYSSFDVDKAISELSEIERLTLSKAYNLYDGNYRMDCTISDYDSKVVSNIIDVVKFNLPRARGKRKVDQA